ncbi:hypothetical protein Trydic_g16362 [Trypoxylus dichotomus]
MLIGAELFWHLLCVGQIKIPNLHLVVQKIRLGWVISRASERPATSNYTPEEAACENDFKTTHKRDEHGRFIVHLPFKEKLQITLGDSREAAIKRFYNLDRKFSRQPELKQECVNFINEYLALGHMKLVDDWVNAKHDFYLPHLAVLKSESITTKLRAVFGASAKTSSGSSLNDILMVGPVIQGDLFSIVCRFRTYKIVLTADIAKMYKQILVANTCSRESFNYGTSSASFLATRALHQLAQEESATLPIDSKMVLSDFYMDDLLTGADTPEMLERIFHEVNGILEKGSFNLRKWASNDQQLLAKLLPDAVEPMVLNLDDHGSIKT